MSILVTVDKFHDPDEVLSALRDLGIAGRRIGLGRTLHVDCETPDSFPLRGDPRIWAVEDINDDYRSLGAVARQGVSLPENLFPATGNWALPRIIRRNPPWDWRRHKAPFVTFYEAGLDGSGVDIYVCDTGVRRNHVEFGGRVTTIHDPASTANGDVSGHGTGCASMAAGAACGLARGASIFASKTMGDNNTGNTFTITSGLQAALDHYLSAPRVALNRPAVVNLSFGGSVPSPGQADIIAQMIEAGMVVVAAAGNSLRVLGTGANQTPSYPASYDNVIAVGGSNVLDEPYQVSGAEGTNFGPNVHLVAPGQFVRIGYGSGGDSLFLLATGTSFSAPAVVGAIACLLTGSPRLTSRAQVQQVRWQLRNMATRGKLTTVRGPVNALPDRLLYLDPGRTEPLAFDSAPFDPAYTPGTPTGFSNGSFETGTPNVNAAVPGWIEFSPDTAAYDVIQITNASAQVGSQSLTFARRTTLVSGRAAYIETAVAVSLSAAKAEIAATGAETLTLTLGGRSSETSDGPASLRPIVFFYDAEGDFVSNWIGDTTPLPGANTEWADYSWGPMPVPPMARLFRVRLWAIAPASANTIRAMVDNFRVSYGSGP